MHVLGERSTHELTNAHILRVVTPPPHLCVFVCVCVCAHKRAPYCVVNSVSNLIGARVRMFACVRYCALCKCRVKSSLLACAFRALRARTHAPQQYYMMLTRRHHKHTHTHSKRLPELVSRQRVSVVLSCKTGRRWGGGGGRPTDFDCVISDR